jgi:hypothetical protein
MFAREHGLLFLETSAKAPMNVSQHAREREKKKKQQRKGTK